MQKGYKIVEGKDSCRALKQWLGGNPEALLPVLGLVESCNLAVEEVISQLGRAAVEALLEASAQSVAGPRHQGRRGGEVRRHGSQMTAVRLAGRRLRVRRPRLRRRGKGKGAEVPIPALEAINGRKGTGRRILEILMRGVSSRHYGEVIDEMAGTAGVSRASVSREFIRHSARQLKRLAERRFDDADLLVIFIDGIGFGGHQAICAVGVDSQGRKHVLGISEGATENAESAAALLESLVQRGVDPSRRCLFVIDGSKALRAAVERVFGAQSPVQRCRLHKERNVCEKLPERVAEDVQCAMRAAYKLPYESALKRLSKQAEWLQRRHPKAAASPREGLEETLTINRLGLPLSLRASLGSTNLIESPFSGLKMRTRRVGRWRNGRMVLRWAASALLETEKNFKRIPGWKNLPLLKESLQAWNQEEAGNQFDRDEEAA